MARRVASKATPSMAHTKPMNTNLISPMDAMMTPTTMAVTFPRVLRFGGVMPRAQVTRRVTTGVVAWLSAFVIGAESHTLSIWMKATDRWMYVMLLNIRLRLKKTPMGTMARR
jgi:hypothetical protein